MVGCEWLRPENTGTVLSICKEGLQQGKGPMCVCACLCVWRVQETAVISDFSEVMKLVGIRLEDRTSHLIPKCHRSYLGTLGDDS